MTSTITTNHGSVIVITEKTWPCIDCGKPLPHGGKHVCVSCAAVRDGFYEQSGKPANEWCKVKAGKRRTDFVYAYRAGFCQGAMTALKPVSH